MSCTIKPTGLPLLTFIRDEIVIKAEKIDCSKVLQK